MFHYCAEYKWSLLTEPKMLFLWHLSSQFSGDTKCLFRWCFFCSWVVILAAQKLLGHYKLYVRQPFQLACQRFHFVFMWWYVALGSLLKTDEKTTGKSLQKCEIGYNIIVNFVINKVHCRTDLKITCLCWRELKDIGLTALISLGVVALFAVGFC